MNLTEREWRTSFRHEDGDLIELFYNPALACAVQYDRMTGYFPADALALAARGIAWVVQRSAAKVEFVVATRFGPRQVASLEELFAALDVVGEPCEFPYADWPGVSVSAIA